MPEFYFISVSKSFIEILSVAQKKLLRISNVKFGKGTKRVDNNFFEKIEDGNEEKVILIDLEMEKKFNYFLIEKYYDYSNSLRRVNN